MILDLIQGVVYTNSKYKLLIYNCLTNGTQLLLGVLFKYLLSLSVKK